MRLRTTELTLRPVEEIMGSVCWSVDWADNIDFWGTPDWLKDTFDHRWYRNMGDIGIDECVTQVFETPWEWYLYHYFNCERSQTADIEKDVLKHGFDPDRPIGIDDWAIDGWTITEGHHRLAIAIKHGLKVYTTPEGS